MDHFLTGSITAVREFGIGEPELWFTLITEVYQELESSEWGPDFVDFTARFTDRATTEGLRAAAEEFVRYAEANGGIDLVRRAHDEGVANLVYEFERLLAGEAADAQASTQESELGYAYDEDAWNAFLPEIGAQWNGEQDAWQPWVDWFVHHADDRGLAEPAAAFVEYAEAQPDKVAVFAAYGIDVAGPPVDEAGEADAGELDTDAWEAFLAHFGSDWNGDDAVWPQFVEWFMHHAALAGLTSVADGFIQYAEGEPDRIAFFARYGIVIAPPETDVAVVAQQRIEAVVAASASIEDEHIPLLAGTLAELLTELPEAALLPDEQLRRLIEEITAEHL